jgi:hypothetical protein
MRQRVLVAESSLTRKSLAKGESSRRGEHGAELAILRNSNSGEDKLGRSRDTVLLGLTENFGIGKELGGGELE